MTRAAKRKQLRKMDVMLAGGGQAASHGDAAPLPSHDTAESIEFLERFAPKDTWVLVAIFHNHTIETTSFSVGKARAAATTAWIEACQGRANIYFQVNPPIRPLSSKARKEDILRIDWLHVDVDPRKGEGLAAERERILRLLRGYKKEPTVIIDSGGGFQAFWKLRPSGKLMINGDVAKAEELERYNVAIARDLGGDHCHNVDRIMRLPGTINLPNESKRKLGRVPALASLVERRDVVYDIEEFSPATGEQGSTDETPKTDIPEDAGPVGIEAIKAWATKNGRIISDDCCKLIVKGSDPKYTSRSEALFRVVIELVRLGVPDALICGLITGPCAIAESVRENQNPRRYALRQIERAKEAIHGADGQTYPHPRTGGRFRVDDSGTWYDPPDNSEAPPTWLASQIRLLAASRDDHGAEWGTVVDVVDADGVTHTWAMPRELLADGGAGVWRELYRLGASVAMSPKARGLLTSFLSEVTPTARARCVSRTGWHEVAGTHVYVRTDGVIGGCPERVVYQSASAVTVDCAISGTVDEWQRAVAALAVGNSRVVFAISVALAAPLLALADEPSGGLHLVGASTTSKTTSLKVAASVYGAPDRCVRTWRATSNGLESTAAAHNDGLLCLDELAQLDPREASTAAYMLSNQQGKSRASRTGAARPVAEWRLIYLSTGEQSLADHGGQSGLRTSPGAEVRLVNVPVDAGAGMGGIEVLHGHEMPAALADALRSAASRFHGAVGRDWLRRLVDDRAQIVSTITSDLKALVATLAPVGASGQVTRVARRFALVAHAGELATRCGLTGWRKGEATTATKRCFDAWVADFGGGDGKRREDKHVISQVRAFLEQHGASRFQALGDVGKSVPNRCGFWRAIDSTRPFKIGGFNSAGREFLILPEMFKAEVCKGMDIRAAVRVLRDCGALLGCDGRHTTQKVQIPEIGRCRVYVIGPQLWIDVGDDDGDSSAPHAPHAANHVGHTKNPRKPEK